MVQCQELKGWVNGAIARNKALREVRVASLLLSFVCAALARTDMGRAATRCSMECACSRWAPTHLLPFLRPYFRVLRYLPMPYSYHPTPPRYIAMERYGMPDAELAYAATN
eukprot:2265500-Rhodomonas_salina.3